MQTNSRMASVCFGYTYLPVSLHFFDTLDFCHNHAHHVEDRYLFSRGNNALNPLV